MIHQIGTFEHGSRMRQNELAAMRDLSTTLEGLDDQARTRVIRWAIEAFGITVADAVERQPAPVVARFRSSPLSMDPTLTVDGVDAFFDLVASRAPHPDLESRPPMSAALAEADAQDEFDEWRPAIQAEKPAPGVVSMLHGFVEDFQRLARDWSDKTEPR